MTQRRLFSPEIMHLCAECGDPLDGGHRPWLASTEFPGHWRHHECREVVVQITAHQTRRTWWVESVNVRDGLL